MAHHRVISDRLMGQKHDMEYVCIGPVPASEECTQLGDHFSRKDNELECDALIYQLIRENGEPPVGAEFFILKNTGHDFGEYFEAAIMYNIDEKYEAAMHYAYQVEDLPELWDALALKFLKDNNYSRYETPVINIKRAG